MFNKTDFNDLHQLHGLNAVAAQIRTEISSDSFDRIVRNRIHADDFAQPQIPDVAFYKERAINQIVQAISAIRNATNQHDFTNAIAQANAFIDAALDYEFINLSEKSAWLDEMAAVVRIQTIGESA